MADTPALRKARGAFFTPPELSRFVADWAVRSADDRVLEPSCGEAEFLVAAGARFRALGAGDLVAGGRLQGVELHPASAATAAERLRRAGISAEIEVADFFDVAPAPRFDAVIGNPPYVRYQQFSGAARRKGLEAALSQGVRLTGLASAWAPFTVHAARFLNPRGRLGLVLPAELLTVNYAAPLREFLLRRFARVRLIAFETRVFPEVLEEVVLLLAEGSGGAAGFELVHLRGVDELATVDGETPDAWTPEHAEAKWTAALLNEPDSAEYHALVDGASLAPLSTWGETYLGGVTGANTYFALTREAVNALALDDGELVPISPPGSRHFGGVSFTRDDWRRLADAGARTLLFRPDPARLSDAAARYVQAGERDGVHHAYKCRIRDPWWRVPLVRVPDLFLTYMSHLHPRMVSNHAGVHHLNSVHGVALRNDVRAIGRRLLPLAALNTITLLSAELVGRAYGGGILKLEPREASRWIVPSAELVTRAAEGLDSVRAAASANPSMTLDEIVCRVDRVLLESDLGVSADVLHRLRGARAALVKRRTSRAGGARAAR